MSEQEWRLRLDLDKPSDLGQLLMRLRERSGSLGDGDAQNALGDDIVLTHDGSTLFAYSTSDRALDHARGAIESLLHDEQREAKIRICRWDETTRRWTQVLPPLTAEEEEDRTSPEDRLQAAAEATNTAPETRTVACVIGKLIRKPFEQQMVGFAESIGLRCEIVEHPHLLSTQAAFTVTGAPDDVDQFESYLKSEARMSIRMDAASRVPFGMP